MVIEPDLNHIMVDETWLYLHKVKGYIPGDDISISVQQKSDIPKVILVFLLQWPNPLQNTASMERSHIRVCEEMVAKRKSTYHEAGEIYIHDCTRNAERYWSFMMQVFEM
jgi:hypothetical protein